MSTREPMWFCHQCNAEIRPLMVPEPVCASCHGQFVEKIEDADDDPREFQHADPGGDNGADPFLMLLQGLMSGGTPGGRRSSSPSSNPTQSGNSPSVRSGSNGPAVITIGGGNTVGGSPRRPPNMNEYINGGGENERGPGIAGPLMAQYLMAMLGHRGPNSDLFGGFGDAVERGRMGDYVFNQEALDQIISNLMENSNASRPVPATDDIMEKLPREVLEEGSSTLDKDCAVCKEQFSLQTEDPEEQIVVKLPCGHPFHSSCILPWLKSSGTCPVCRHQLVPQPEHHSPPPRTPSPGGSSSRRPGGGEGDGSIFQSLFGSVMGSGARSSGNNTSGSTTRSSNPSNRQGEGEHHLPGGWDDELD
ncbi:hypothetical protein D9757_002772 [Collybiopsis confluens]|uniref:RING-type E3 ubiquitin transferase n=1 Tax=Collybiopsis confluens TaxID=2823264 RepID=A0A8H5HVY7_9AGAR|nr:hypothetical protein D9757_002772 [Collybiopsis confluens]